MIFKLIFLSIFITVSSSAMSIRNFVNDFHNRTNKSVYLDKYLPNDDINVDVSYSLAVNQNDLEKSFYSTILNNSYAIDNSDGTITITKLKKDDSILPALVDNNTSSAPSISVIDTSNYPRYTYSLKYISFDDVISSISVFEGVNYKYLKNYNRLIFACDSTQHDKIYSFLKKIDQPILSKNIKITIFDSSDSVIDDIGTKISALDFKLDSSFINGNFINNSYAKFGFYMSALRTDAKIKINQSPTFTLFNGSPLTFKTVKNIPYITQTNKTDNTSTSTTNSIAYKDVGLQLFITPAMSSKSTILNLKLLSEDLLDINSDKPITSKLEYENSVILTNKPILLTGFKKNNSSSSLISVPLLSDIPYLGNLFKYKINKNESSNLSILIEYLPNKVNHE